MCEVTAKNFEEIYPQIIDDLHSASFISIDCEFSGLFDDEFQYSLFDSPAARFKKLQKCLDAVRIIQFGLSTFKKINADNKCAVASYSFYLKPATALRKEKLTYQMGSVIFLCKNNFNFNKLFYDGVFYLNKSYKKLVLSMIKDGSLINFDTYKEVQKYCSKVAHWRTSAPDGSEMMLELENESSMFVYILHGEIRKRFPDVWTCIPETNIIRIKKLKDSDREVLVSLKEEETFLNKKLLDSITGFTKILEEIENLKKPIVGHNIFIDLILIYQQFYNPLPVSYRNFKNEISKIFPIVYDTKLISFRLRDMLPKESIWNSNDLSSLYGYLKNGKGSTLVIFTPTVSHRNERFVEEEHFHDAGFDSYCTGYCFLKMAHIFSLWNDKEQSLSVTSLPVTSKWLLEAVSSTRNQVNLSRGQVNHIVLDGDDPKSVRPSLLYIYSRTKEPLNVPEISQIVAKYSSDIQLLSKYSGLLALRNRQQFKEVQESFKNHKNYRVIKYSFLRHSKSGRRILTGTVILSVIFITFSISKKFR